jgi:hypothetical protein
VRGVVRTRNGAARLETFCPPHPAPVLACGRGVEALVLALRDGPQALEKVGARLAARGRCPLLQPGRQRASLHEDRLGPSREALCAAHLHRVCGAIARTALAVEALAPPWLQQETTTRTRSGAEEEDARPVQGPRPPRPASGPSTEGQDERTPVLLRLGVSRDGLPWRLGLRDGHTSDRPETPGALAAWWALGLHGVPGLVADRPASCQRPLGGCLAQGVGRRTGVPRTGAVRPEVAAWGQPQGACP